MTITPYEQMSTEDLRALEARLQQEYQAFKAKGLKLNMARGKPSDAQLALSLPLLEEVNSHSDLIASDGTNCANYGGLAGIPEARKLMGDVLGVPADNVIMGGSASLALMYDAIDRAYTHGVLGSTPWCKLDEVKWICPVPGYDRHFAITEHFGFTMINVPLTGHGPDMDQVEELVKDPAVKGIWCVPKYSNPTGETYSDETVRRMASLKPAAKDFRIFWDNAYAVHHLYEDEKDQDQLLEILSACEEAGNPDLVYEFASTSKVTFPGAGISCMAASRANVDDALAQMGVRLISNDKINQLRHARFLSSAVGVANHMKKHAALLRPKFKLVDEVLTRELEGTGIATWTKPRGGYFVSFSALPGCAKAIVDKTKEAGLTLTGAGAPFPYHKDPEDSVIRIAPSLPPIDELSECMDLFALCVRLVSAGRILSLR